MITRLRNALVFALLLPLATMAVAEARPGGSSFRGGFSSQKSTAARNSATPKQPSFGSFGSRRPDAAPARSPDAARGSAASRDLDRRAAQERAMRNWDSRRDASAASGAGARSSNGATPPLPPLNPVLPGGASMAGRSASGTGASAGSGAAYGSSGGAAGHGGGFGGGSGVAGAGGTAAGGYGQPGPAPVVVRDRGSSPWLWGIGGYLLGNSVLSHAKDSPPAASPSASTTAPAGATPGETMPAGDATGGAATTAAATSTPGDAAGTAVTTAATTASAVAGREQAAREERNTVRTLTWLALLMGFTWLLYLGWRQVKAGKKHANYSFERN